MTPAVEEAYGWVLVPTETQAAIEVDARGPRVAVILASLSSPFQGAERLARALDEDSTRKFAEYLLDWLSEDSDVSSQSCVVNCVRFLISENAVSARAQSRKSCSVHWPVGFTQTAIKGAHNGLLVPYELAGFKKIQAKVSPPHPPPSTLTHPWVCLFLCGSPTTALSTAQW